MIGVPLTAGEVQDFYLGFSNRIIWPLFHDLQSLCDFDPAFWRVYREVNRKYAQVVSEVAEPGDLLWADLLAYYRAAHIALVTPLKDGMNLVAKEYCASSIEEDCVLILSEFAGAAAQLHRGALLVNPYDIEGVADAIHRAWDMPAPQCRARMRRLRRQVRERDVYRWLDQYLNVAFACHLHDHPSLPADVGLVEPDHLPI